MKRLCRQSRPRWQQLQRCWGLAMMLGCLVAGGSAAQVMLDGSLGAAKHLTGPHYVVSARHGQIRGANLFHSFGTLHVLTGQSLTFTGPPTIDNILSRVTGKTPSFIDGTLRSTVPGANLFVFNPQGVIFGLNATLDVSGSFHVSTAEAVRFADGRRFSTLRPQAQLSIAAPEAFGFLGRQTPAALTILGSALHVPAGQTVSVVGGEVTVLGHGAVSRDVPNLAAPGGRIQVVSRATAGEVDITSSSHPGGLLGSVRIAQEALLRASGDGGGSVVIRAGRIVVDKATVVASTVGSTPGVATAVEMTATESISLKNGTVVTANALGTGAAGDIRLAAPTVRADTGAAIVAQAVPGSSGDGGRILLTAERVALRNGAVLLTATAATGRGGDIVIDVHKLTLCNAAGLTTLALADGAGGSIRIAAREAVTLQGRDANGFQSALTSATSGRGAAGQIHLTAPTLALQDGLMITDTRGRGHGGDISVTVGQCLLTEGGRISSSAMGVGAGGKVTVNATAAVRIQGSDATAFPSGIFNLASGRGDAGEMTLTAPIVSVNGGYIGGQANFVGRTGTIAIHTERFQVRRSGQILAGTTMAQPGGSVSITATQSIVVVGQAPGAEPSGVRSLTRAPGAAGTLSLRAPTIAITEGIVQTTNLGPGRGGDIVVQVGRLRLRDGAVIDSSTVAQGQGGHLTITATQAIVVTGVGTDDLPSGVTSFNLTSAQPGRLSLTAPEIVIHNRGIVAASTLGSGQAGRVTIQADRLTVSAGGNIDSGAFGPGQGGVVRVTVADTLTLVGQGQGPLGTSSSISSTADLGGQVGRVFVTAPTVQIVGGDLAISQNSIILPPTTPHHQVGRLVVRAERLILRAGARIDSSTVGPIDAGHIRVIATESIFMTGQSQVNSITRGTGAAGRLSITTPVLHLHGTALQASTAAEGQAGDITVRAERVELTAGSGIVSNSNGAGQGGTVRIVATEAIRLLGSESLIASFASNLGDAGQVRLKAPTIRVEGGIILTATGGAGNAGDMTIHSRRFDVLQGGAVDSSTLADGHGGIIRITATRAVRIVGHNAVNFTSVIGSSAGGDGAAGSIRINTATLHLDEGGIAGTTLPGSTGRAGAVQVHAKRVRLVGGAEIDTTTLGTGQGGQVRIMATHQMTIKGEGQGTQVSRIASRTAGSADAGSVVLSAPIMRIDGGEISTITLGSGQAGKITLRARRLSLAGSALVNSSSLASGSGGTVTVRATESMTMRGPSHLLSAAGADGDAGHVAIVAGMLRMQGVGSIEATTIADGDAGRVDVWVQRLHMQGGAQIGSTSGTVDADTGEVQIGSGRGGAVAVTATERIFLQGKDRTGRIASGFFSETGGVGNAGSVTVSTPSLVMQDGSVIAANTGGDGAGGDITIQTGTLAVQSGAQLQSSSGIDVGDRLFVGTGQGGRITVMASQSMNLRGADSGLFTRTRGAGQGGNVFVQAPQLHLTDGATISAASVAAGNAGGMQLQVTDSMSMTNSTITTEATQAAGGDIRIQTPSQMRLRQSAITATVQGGPQTVGGDITVAADVMILQGSRVSANASAGRGGNIRLTAELLFADPLSTISASSELGIDGAVDIQAPVANLSGVIAPLPQTFAHVTELLSAHCAARWRAEKSSSFVLGGRDGVPVEPGALLPSPLATLVPTEAAVPSTASTHSQGFLRQGRLPAATMLVDCARVRGH